MPSETPAQGMYTTKSPHKWHGAVYLAGQYIDSNKQKLDSRFNGKQFLTCPPKAGAAGLKGVLFSEVPTNAGKGNTYDTGTTYLKSYPEEDRKLGFGTHDAPRRDEFMSGQRAMQHKVSIMKEDRSVMSQLSNQGRDNDRNKAENSGGKGDTALPSATSPVHAEDLVDRRVRQLEEKLEKLSQEHPSLGLGRPRQGHDFAGNVSNYLYDIGRNKDGTTPVFLKDGREQFYSHKRCQSTTKTRHVQELSTSSGDYGYLLRNVESLSFNRMSDLVKVNKANVTTGVGHLRIGEDDD